jgi:CHAD domain-containing protein
MAQTDILDSIKTYGHRMAKTAGSFLPKFKAGEVHKLRTQYKQLRALLRWQHEKNNVFPKALRKCYQLAGDIRNLQVLQSHIEARHIALPDFERWLERRLKKACRRWEKQYHPKIFHHSAKPGKPGMHSNWIKKRQQAFSAALHESTDESLHEARKCVKDLDYVKVWSEKNGVDFPGGGQTIQGGLSKKLGRYHDLVIRIQLLETYLGNRHPRQRDHASELLKNWNEQKALQRHQLRCRS